MAMRSFCVFIALLVPLGIVSSYASVDPSHVDRSFTINSAANEKRSIILSKASHHNRLLKGEESQSSARIVNGWEAESGQFPYTGYVVTEQSCLTPTPSSRKLLQADSTKSNQPPVTTEKQRFGICASSLIMPRVLVSAGHCLYECSTTEAPDSLPGEIPNSKTEENSWGGPITVKMNQLNVSQPTWQNPGAEERIISGATRHPRYTSKDNIPTENDIAIMWFDNPSQITPAQIASKTTFDLGQSFMVAGWGYTNPDKSSLSQTLLTTIVPYYPLPLCIAKYNTLSTPIQVSNGDICAGGDPSTNYADSCSGDSGGPLLMNVTTYLNRTATMRQCVGCVPQQLVGLTSYGEGCGNAFPGVYTNVPMQADWLDQTITLSNAGGIEQPAIGCSSHVGQRYYGRSNSTLMNIPNAAQCCNACKVNGTASCRSWTWHKATNRCILIKKVEKRGLAGTWTSGNTTGTLAPKSSTCELEFYVQYTSPGASNSSSSGSSGSSPAQDPNRQVRVSHILLPAGSESTIKEFKSQILSGTATLESLAKEHSTCPSSKKGGDIGWIPKGRTVPEFEVSAYNTLKGEFSTCSTPFGVHLIQVTEERIARDVGNCSIHELAELLSSVAVDQDLLEDVQFVDVREPHEVEIVSLPHFKVLPLGSFQEWAPKISSILDPSKKTYVLCHHGMRSMQAAAYFLENAGFSQVLNISGGIDAYARGVDQNLPRY